MADGYLRFFLIFLVVSFRVGQLSRGCIDITSLMTLIDTLHFFYLVLMQSKIIKEIMFIGNVGTYLTMVPIVM